MTNKQRIEIALSALEGTPEYDKSEDNIVDLIADLLHLAHAQGFDTEAITRMATNHFEAEK